MASLQQSVALAKFHCLFLFLVVFFLPPVCLFIYFFFVHIREWMQFFAVVVVYIGIYFYFLAQP